MSELSTNMIDPVYIAVVVALILVVLTLLIFRRKPATCALLTGLPDSGKTAIFSKIVFNKPSKSVTSLKENEAHIKDFNLKVVDLPGADRLRIRYWEQYRSKAQLIVFVIDSTTVETKLRDLSEYLYTLLSEGSIHKNRVRFIIACNKQDLKDSLSKGDIKNILERELEAIRATKKGQLGKTSSEEEEDYLSSQAGQISFDSMNIELIETSLHNVDQLIKLII